MLNEKENLIGAFVPASLFIVLVVYLLMSDPFIISSFKKTPLLGGATFLTTLFFYR